MRKITSAYANKMLRSLEEDKSYWVNKENESNTYVAGVRFDRQGPRKVLNLSRLFMYEEFGAPLVK